MAYVLCWHILLARSLKFLSFNGTWLWTYSWPFPLFRSLEFMTFSFLLLLVSGGFLRNTAACRPKRPAGLRRSVCLRRMLRHSMLPPVESLGPDQKSKMACCQRSAAVPSAWWRSSWSADERILKKPAIESVEPWRNLGWGWGGGCNGSKFSWNIFSA